MGLIPRNYFPHCFIYDYMWSNIKTAVLRKEPPPEEIKFWGSLPRLLQNILQVYPVPVTITISNFDLVYAYIHVCIRP